MTPLCTMSRLAQLQHRQAQHCSRPPGENHTPPDATLFPESLVDSIHLAESPFPPSTTRAQWALFWLLSPSGTLPTTKRYAIQASLFFPYRLVAHLVPPSITSVASLLLVLGTSREVPKNPIAPHASLITKHAHLVITT